jgi:hypothetical protein
MRELSFEPPGQTTENNSRSRRRRTERIPTQFSLMYSGMSAGQMLIGNGIVTNLSDAGIGIRGNRLVKSGMELALYIDLPGIEEPLCIAQSRVTWVSERRFGVELVTPKIEVQNQLQFCVWNRLFRPSNKKS